MTKEELQEILNSWENLDLLINEAMGNPEYVKLLFEIALFSNHPKSWRAAWIADKINDKKPELTEPFIHDIIIQLKNETSSSKKRQFLKLISLHPIPEEHCSFLLDYCIQCFTSTGEPIAVRVFAMQVLYSISEIEPELKPELLSTIQHEMELHSSAGIKSRGTKLAKQLYLDIKKSGIAFH
jgi:hypothetical protein